MNGAPLITEAQDGWEALRAAVFSRDGGCMAPRLDPHAGPCGGRLTLDHVQHQMMFGRRAPHDEAHLVAECERHHIWAQSGVNWATSHRPLLREYLRGLYPEVAGWRDHPEGAT